MCRENHRIRFRFAALFIAILGLLGCDRPALQSQKQAKSQAPKIPAKKVTRNTKPDAKVGTGRAVAGRPDSSSADATTSVPTPDSPSDLPQSRLPVKPTLGPEEAKELASLLKWCSSVREKEENPVYCRQRPVCLMVMGADPDLEDLVTYSLQAAELQQLCNWDVTLLLYQTGDENHDLENLRQIRSEIELINCRIAGHQQRLDGNALPNAAPLRPLQSPLTYANKEELERVISGWLALNFAPRQSASQYNSASTDSRPPFGNIWFHGHGRTRVDTDRMSPQFSVNHDSWFDILALERSIMYRFQAPVWINLDLCRNKVKGDIEEATSADRDAGELESREYHNLDEFDAETQEFVTELEHQRSRLTAGYLIAASPAEAGVTKLFPTNKTVSIDNSYGSLLATATSKLLKQSTTESDTSRLIFENAQFEANTLTLRQQLDFTRNFFREQNELSAPEPLLSPGTINDQLVVYSTQSMNYTPQYVNLLRGGVRKSAGDFHCRELHRIFSSYNDSISISRPSDGVEDDRNFVLSFLEPVALDSKVPYQLVLIVSGESENVNDSLAFVVGAYSFGTTSDRKPREVVNSSFRNYGNTDVDRYPVRCDGSIRVVHAALDTLAEVVNAEGQFEVSEIEIQTIPANPKKWSEGATLKIHGAYILPENVTAEDLKAELQRAQAAPTLAEMTYWMLPFHRNPKSVNVHLTDANDTRLSQTDEKYMGTWGVAGQIYPKQFVNSSSRQIRLKLRADEEIDAAAEVLVLVNDGDQILTSWRSSLQTIVGQEIPIDFNSDGIAEEVMIGVRNYPGNLIIESLTLEKRSSGLQ